MSPKLFVGCSGWNYGDSSEKGGWLNVFYPDNKTRKLNYYSQFFNTVEMDATFYNRFYQQMTQGLFVGIARTTPPDFKISVKVPEIITHDKRLDIDKDVMTDLNKFLDKISPLQNFHKLGVIIIQLPPSFTISESEKLEEFLEVLKNNPDMQIDNKFAIEFRHTSWNTEGVLELLQHYDIASVLTDSPAKENLEFLSNENNVTSKSASVVRLHGRNTTQGHYWYNYLYSQEELKPWVTKIEKMKQKTDTIFVYFNNHYGGKALVNALQFKEMINHEPLPENEKKALEKAKKYLSNQLL
ncbi:DUF72 domain-containing protein [Candidatus Nitrosocosmicus hydrocola]|uniref:DUF72 domain-containing protein n=1 Tax=Candidatus Nitrosocosmicus hydrocola TaxID=1826872 RepID=UPI0011E5F7CD|nr:DUF72 domain-containing protein [Candidatus Nitrosocosmicus hydrocola]